MMINNSDVKETYAQRVWIMCSKEFVPYLVSNQTTLLGRKSITVPGSYIFSLCMMKPFMMLGDPNWIGNFLGPTFPPTNLWIQREAAEQEL